MQAKHEAELQRDQYAAQTDKLAREAAEAAALHESRRKLQPNDAPAKGVQPRRQQQSAVRDERNVAGDPFHFGVKMPHPLLWVGIILVGLGAALVLYSKEVSEAAGPKTAAPLKTEPTPTSTEIKP